jgi:hypothetical protein
MGTAAHEGSVGVCSAEVAEELPAGKLPVTAQVPERREIDRELAVLDRVAATGEMVESAEQVGMVGLEAIKGVHAAPSFAKSWARRA